jgi:hypothetical protein
MFLAILTSSLIAISAANEINPSSWYKSASPIDTSDSLARVRAAPIKVYEYVHDSVAGRKQLGILGQDAQRWFPEAVDIIPTYTVPNKDRSKPAVTMKNFPVVDKSMIFMHGIAAVQELSRLFDGYAGRLAALQNSEVDHASIVDEIEARLSREADAQLLEAKKLAEAEAQLAKKEVELEKAKAEADREAIRAEIVEEKNLLNYERSLGLARMQEVEALEKERSEAMLALEGQLAERREEVGQLVI